MTDIQAIIHEAAALAESLIESPLYFKSRQVSEGVEAMQQAAAAFDSGKTSAEKIDAAIWLGEAYLILSSGLPDVGNSEKSTGWATAAQISKLLGGPEIWEQRVKSEIYKSNHD